MRLIEFQSMKKNAGILLVLAGFVLFSTKTLFAQNEPVWDSATQNKWSSDFQKIEIPSTVDGKIQNAYLYKSKSKTEKPLIVSLHTWSHGYDQEDPLSKEILARDWNYIHPDFRGPNKTIESMGSKLVISDIEDAIQFALKNTNSNPKEVHIIGVSGGGLAALAAYMNIHYPVKSFSAWAPITDLEAWYWESVGRKNKYAGHILQALSNDSTFNREEAIIRSPLKQTFPHELRRNSKLYIYEGIHDGYSGSVPITHSINMYNRLVGELKYGISDLDQIANKAKGDSSLVSEKEIIGFLTKRIYPSRTPPKSLFSRNIHLFREFDNIQLTIFEGEHEQLPQALGLIPVDQTTLLEYNILTLGDSNGENTDGWVDQLKKMMPKSNIVNISKGGRTIGFDNLGRKELNELANIDDFMDQAKQKMGNKKYDFIFICLGTNDTKKVFEDQQAEVTVNFEALLKKIKRNPLYKKDKPRLVYITPPPIRTYNILGKYEGSNERLTQLVPKLSTIAKENGFQVVNVYDPMLGVLDYYAADGIHMAGPGQEIVASKIIEAILPLK